MEMRGDLRRGEFVEGHGPVQYAGEETVEALRARRERREPKGGVVLALSGADPAAFGSEPPLSPQDLAAFSEGDERVRLTAGGELTFAGEVSDHGLREALLAFQEVKRRARDPLARPRLLAVKEISGRPVAGSPYAPLLASLGFTRDGGAYVWRAI
jgi:hypothetical protein